MQNSTKKCRCVRSPDDTAVADMPYLLDRKRAAFLLSLSLRSIDYLIAEGRLRTRRIGGRILLPTADLMKFADSDRIKPIVPTILAAENVIQMPIVSREIKVPNVA
jgi:excisionase family DNA binding protein